METQVTALIQRLAQGDESATPALFAALHGELRRLANGYLKREARAETLQPTGLVHEAYVRLVGKEVPWQNRAHFFGIAARVMRQILVDHARERDAAKRGDGVAPEPLHERFDVGEDPRSVDLVALDRAIDELQQVSERQAKVVELRYFAGLSVEETAEALGTGTGTIKRDWAFAKAFLKRHLEDS